MLVGQVCRALCDFAVHTFRKQPLPKTGIKPLVLSSGNLKLPIPILPYSIPLSTLTFTAH